MKKRSLILILMLLLLCALMFTACPIRGEIVVENNTDERVILWIEKEGRDYLTNISEDSYNYDEEKAYNVINIAPDSSGNYTYPYSFIADWDFQIGDTHYIDSKNPDMHEDYPFQDDNTVYTFEVSGSDGHYRFDYDIDYDPRF